MDMLKVVNLYSCARCSNSWLQSSRQITVLTDIQYAEASSQVFDYLHTVIGISVKPSSKVTKQVHFSAYVNFLIKYRGYFQAIYHNILVSSVPCATYMLNV